MESKRKEWAEREFRPNPFGRIPMTRKKDGEMEASGAIIAKEDKAIDTSHPAVDANPRQGDDLPPEANQIDFNVPSAQKPAKEAVADNLKAQD